MSTTTQFPIEYVESHGKPFATPQALVVHSRRSDEVGRWYRKFGFEVFRQKAADGSDYITARCAGLLLKILSAQTTHEAEKATLYLVVDDFEAMLGAVAALNATVLTAPQQSLGRRRIVLTDPDGRRVVLSERETKPATAMTAGRAEEELHDADESEAATPEQAEFERAFAAVRRGAKASLLAICVNIVIGIVVLVFVLLAVFDARAKNPQWLQGELNKIPIGAAMIIGTVFAFGALLVSAWHRTKRVNYAGLWVVIVLDGLSILASIVALFGALREWEVALSTINYLAAFAPILYFHFLAEFFKAASDESAAGQMNATMYIYFAFALSAVGILLRSLLPPPLPDSPYLLVAFGVLMIVAGVAFVLALVRVATLRRDH